nr:uncharacterized protein LOC113395245 [Vanessa tameamea]
MGRRRSLCVFLALSVLANAFCLPSSLMRSKRQSSSPPIEISTSDSEITVPDSSLNTVNYDLPPSVPYNDDDDDDDDFDTPTTYPSDGGGSNIFSLLKLVTAFLPGSSTSSNILMKLVKEIVKRNMPKIIIRRQGVADNEIDIDYLADLKPPTFQKQEYDNNDSNSDSEQENEIDEDEPAEQSLEDDRNNSEQDSDSNLDEGDDDDDYDEPPGGGDGEGGGILGLLAGLSGGEDGQSDLGSLLATISGIIANLSGDGIDLNALIASGIGLFVGLLSEGEENPGAIIASYLLTSLDTITGGGAKNNGAFFGKFLSKLVKGTSAAGDPDASSEEEDNGNKMIMADSAGFFLSFITSLLGDMSKSSSSSHPWRRYFKET